ncbi:MAG: hypothetical protein PVJ89_06685 [Planctomycetota bacterium]|jgi:hypothetical protein
MGRTISDDFHDPLDADVEAKVDSKGPVAVVGRIGEGAAGTLAGMLQTIGGTILGGSRDRRDVDRRLPSPSDRSAGPIG